MLIPVASASFADLLKPVTVLAGDIGGTKTNLALYTAGKNTMDLLKQNQYSTTAYSNMIDMLVTFIGTEKNPDRISLAAAGPIQDGQVQMTNHAMQVSSKEISLHFNNIPVFLINDLEAAAFGLASLEEKDVAVFCKGIKKETGNIGVIAPGTGLGEAGLYADGKIWHPFATEGGHSDFAPRTDLDWELYQYLEKQFGHVSWERLLSGPGICNIFDFLVKVKEREVPAAITQLLVAGDKAAVIGTQAGQCAVCTETIDLFFRYLAQESSNLALKLKATGGLFITGGIVPKIRHLAQPEIFS
ncbi:MAG: ROK family protein, partial [Chitinophagaceae bacterium]|nr:ROK family protein [Chitinophagaceae bacterium]